MNELNMNEQMTNATASWRVFDDITYKYVWVPSRWEVGFCSAGKLKQERSRIIHCNFENRQAQLEH